MPLFKLRLFRICKRFFDVNQIKLFHNLLFSDEQANNSENQKSSIFKNNRLKRKTASILLAVFRKNLNLIS
ncbi:MAG TPA: hypothetical protein DEH24_01260 [Alteromonas sp.]|jgi:hypothetical protein|nr:hypothetical protein [Alteromonadaceae bacterium]HBY38011.1 hypothetical protein [Alteromonas sp.]